MSTIVLTNPADLRVLASRRPARPRPTRLVLELPGVEGEEKIVLERRLNRHYFACGCEVGAVFAFAALLGLAVTMYRAGLSSLTWRDALVAAAIVLAAAGFGKGLGLSLARWRLRRVVADLERRLGA